VSTKKIHQWARETQTGWAVSKAVLLLLASHANSDGEIRHGTNGDKGLSASTIAAELEISRRSAQRALQDLQDHGLIAAERTMRANGSNASCVYLLLSDSAIDVRGWRLTVATPGDSQTLASHSHQGVASVSHHQRTGETRGVASDSRQGGDSQTPLEEKILTTNYQTSDESESVSRARGARAREAVNDRPTLEQLNATGVKNPKAYVILWKWRAEHAESEHGSYDLATYRKLGPHIDDALTKGRDEPTILDGLRKWDRKGSKATPGLLPSLIDDAVHDQRAGADPNRVWIDADGVPTVPIDQIPDSALTRPVLDDLVGKGGQPRPPREIEEADYDTRHAWYVQAHDVYDANRRIQAREVLDRRYKRKLGLA
jgi:hypothetical protein